MIVGSLLHDIVFLGDELRLEQQCAYMWPGVVHTYMRACVCVHGCMSGCECIYVSRSVCACRSTCVFLSSCLQAYTYSYECLREQMKICKHEGLRARVARRGDGQSHPRPHSRQGRHSMIYASAEFLSLVSHHVPVT